MSKYIKTTVEINEYIYKQIIGIRCDNFDHRTMKSIINTALIEYFENRLKLD